MIGRVRKAVLLAGGLGTRLRPLTYLVPKPALPVVNLPLVAHQLLWLAGQGVEQARVSAGYLATQVREALSRRDWGLEVEVVEEPEPLDTAGGIRFAAQGFGEAFVATNGDVLLDAPLTAMAEAHAEAGAAATILLRRVEDVSPFGLVHRDEAGRVTEFLEKRPSDPMGQNTVNAGVYVLAADVLDSVPPLVEWSVEKRLFPDLLAAGRTLVGYLPGEAYYWMDVGRVETYLAAHRDLLDGAVPWCGPSVSPAAEIDASARIVGPVAVGADAKIGAGATVGPHASLGDGAVVGERASVAASVLWAGAEVGAGAELRNTVVATGARVADGLTLQEGMVMPDEYPR